jgi:hypothetical protein
MAMQSNGGSSSSGPAAKRLAEAQAERKSNARKSRTDVAGRMGMGETSSSNLNWKGPMRPPSAILTATRTSPEFKGYPSVPFDWAANSPSGRNAVDYAKRRSVSMNTPRRAGGY